MTRQIQESDSLRGYHKRIVMKMIPGGIAEKLGKVYEPNLKAMEIASRCSSEHTEYVIRKEKS